VWWSWKFKPAAIARMRTAVSIEKLAAELEPKLGQQQPGHRESTYAVIRARMRRQGDHAGIERCCALAEVSRAGYYRH
jgi:hypothetical protein